MTSVNNICYHYLLSTGNTPALKILAKLTEKKCIKVSFAIKFNDRNNKKIRLKLNLLHIYQLLLYIIFETPLKKLVMPQLNI